MAITAFLSRSPGLLNRGPEGPLCWVLVFSTASYLQLSDFLSSLGLYNCSTPTFFSWASQITLNSTRPQSKLYPDIHPPDAPVIYTGAFPILTAWPVSICYSVKFMDDLFWVILWCECEVNWFGPKKICFVLSVSGHCGGSKGTTICHRCTGAVRIRTTHL